jgi:flagellar basal-body rod protein FlgB
MQASSVTDILFNQLGYRGERQKVISSNIANINTPNYKAKDLVFEQELKKAQNKNSDELKLTITNPMHIASFEDTTTKPLQPKLVQKSGLKVQNDGNNVNLDREMSDMAKNSVMFNALQSSIKKDASWFKAVIESSSKN